MTNLIELWPEVSGNISGTNVMAEEQDAEEILSSLTNGQKSLHISPASFLRLSPPSYARGQEADAQLFLEQNAIPVILQKKKTHCTKELCTV